MTRRGAEAFLDGLRAAQLSHVFTLPGTQTLPLLRLIAEQTPPSVQPVFVRSEQAAAFGAVGYARAIGRPAVCLSIPGPGATNMLSGVAAAAADAIPLIAVTPQLDDHLRHRQAVHECDLAALFGPLVKAQLVVTSVDELRPALVEAAAHAMAAPMGPVHVQYPQSLLNAVVAADRPAAAAPVPEPLRAPEPGTVRAIVARLAAAQRPVIYAGSEVLLRHAEDLVATLAERFGAPVFTDEDARGVVDETQRLALGSASHDKAVRAVQAADLCLAVGTRFSEWSTKSWSLKLAELFYLHESPSVAAPTYPATIELTGRVDRLLEAIVAEPAGPRTDRPAWWLAPDVTGKDDTSRRTDMAESDEPGRLHPATVVAALADVLEGRTVVTLDGSSSAMWMAEGYPVRRPRTFLQSEVFREIGSALMMGIGAAVAQPHPVVVVQGDGGMLFQLGELSTIAQAGLRLIIIVFEDGYYNADRLFQEHVYGGRLSDSAVHNPDYVAVAAAFGLHGVRATSPAQIRATITAAYTSDTTTLIIVPTLATAAPGRLRERFVEWRRRLGAAVDE